MTTTSDARKRLAEAQAGPHAGCVPGQCRAGDQWRAVSCLAEPVEQIRALHRDWGSADVEDLDLLDLWERLAVILGEPL